MLFIRHRVNTSADLKTVPPSYGAEIDLREMDGEIILQHDPGKRGELLKDYLKEYWHDVLILNVKTDGIEEEALGLVKKYGVKKYFFLDLAFPTMMKLIRKGEKNIAVRFSEQEPLEQCLALKGKAEWVWVDCFTSLPLDKKTYDALKPHFKICLVSPELQSHPKEMIAQFKKQLQGMEIDAVCTKHPELWQ